MSDGFQEKLNKGVAQVADDLCDPERTNRMIERINFCEKHRAVIRELMAALNTMECDCVLPVDKHSEICNKIIAEEVLAKHKDALE